MYARSAFVEAAGPAEGVADVEQQRRALVPGEQPALVAPGAATDGARAAEPLAGAPSAALAWISRARSKCRSASAFCPSDDALAAARV